MEIAIVYAVAGLSKRFGGKIKQFAKVGPNGESLIEYSLNQAIPAGITKIIFVVGEKTEIPFRQMLGDNYRGIPVYYAFQKWDKEKRDRPWGTLDALCSAKELIDCPFLFFNGDDIYGERTFRVLVEHLKKKESDAIVGWRLKDVLPEKGKVNRALIRAGYNNTVESLEEIFDIDMENFKEKGLNKDDLCSMNAFALHPKTLSSLNEKLFRFKKEHEADRKIECLIQHEITSLINEGKIVMYVYTASDEWLGVTNPEDEDVVKGKLAIR